MKTNEFRMNVFGDTYRFETYDDGMLKVVFDLCSQNRTVRKYVCSGTLILRIANGSVEFSAPLSLAERRAVSVFYKDIDFPDSKTIPACRLTADAAYSQLIEYMWKRCPEKTPSEKQEQFMTKMIDTALAKKQ